MRKLQHDKPTTSSSTTEQTNTNVNASTSVESEEFVKRRDYLMTKLLQSRNLPGNMPPPQPPPPTTIVVEDEKEEEEKDTSASSKSSIPLMSINTTRKPTPSLNEFIPIRFNPPLRIEDTYEQVYKI